jgi:hypothetical protein
LIFHKFFEKLAAKIVIISLTAKKNEIKLVKGEWLVVIISGWWIVDGGLWIVDGGLWMVD